MRILSDHIFQDRIILFNTSCKSCVSSKFLTASDNVSVILTLINVYELLQAKSKPLILGHLFTKRTYWISDIFNDFIKQVHLFLVIFSICIGLNILFIFSQTILQDSVQIINYYILQENNLMCNIFYFMLLYNI